MDNDRSDGSGDFVMPAGNTLRDLYDQWADRKALRDEGLEAKSLRVSADQLTTCDQTGSVVLGAQFVTTLAIVGPAVSTPRTRVPRPAPGRLARRREHRSARSTRTSGTSSGDDPPGDLATFLRLQEAGLSTGEAAEAISEARTSLRSESETLDLAVARVLTSRAEVLDGIAAEHRGIAEWLRGAS